MNYRNSAYGCYCRPPPGYNPPHLQCPADGRPIAGNCSDGVVHRRADGSAVDGMIGKATSAAEAVKASPYSKCRLALGVETSCFPASDSDKKYQYKLSFCDTSADYLAKQMALTAEGMVSSHEIAGIWVAFFQECQQSRCGQEALGLWSGVVDEAMPWVVEDYKALKALEGNRLKSDDTADPRQAFFIFFSSMLESPEWPEGFRQYQNGAVILDPFNVTAATVEAIHTELNATVLLYWDFGDIRSMMWADGVQGFAALGEADPVTHKPVGCRGLSCCDHIRCSPRVPSTHATRCADDEYNRELRAVFNISWVRICTALAARW